MTKYKEAYKIPPQLRTEGIPSSEFSLEFLQGMVSRMGVSFHKYGKVADAYPEKLDAIVTLRKCLEKYTATGNTEYLMDAANYAMIEFMRPRLPGAFFKATEESAGRAKVNGTITSKSNLDLK